MTPTPETGPRQVPEGSPLHASLTEAMVDHGRMERTKPLPPTPEWTVTSSPTEGGTTPEAADNPCPWEAVFPDQSIPCLLERDHEPPHQYTPEPCPECGCLPSDPWGCGCSNEECPCSEAEDEECE